MRKPRGVIEAVHKEHVRVLTEYLRARGLLRKHRWYHRLARRRGTRWLLKAQYKNRQQLIDYLSQYQAGYQAAHAQQSGR